MCLILLRYTPGGVKHVALGEYANVGKEKVVQIDDHFLSCLCIQPQNGQVKKKKKKKIVVKDAYFLFSSINKHCSAQFDGTYY